MEDQRKTAHQEPQRLLLGTLLSPNLQGPEVLAQKSRQLGKTLNQSRGKQGKLELTTNPSLTVINPHFAGDPQKKRLTSTQLPPAYRTYPTLRS